MLTVVSPRPDRGFTLIELTMVLLLSTIIFGLALPRFRDQLFTNDLGRASRMIGGLAQEARLYALRGGQRLIMTIDPEALQLRVFSEETLADGSLKKVASRELKALTLPDSIKITDVWRAGSGKLQGPVDLLFSAKGHADQAVVHLQGASGEQLSLLIEPFLDRVKSVPGYLEITP